MKTVLKFSVLVTFLSVLSISISCKKSDPVNPADKFVGSYSYVLTVTGMTSPIAKSGTFVIMEYGTNKIYINESGTTNTYYTVLGNTITEDSGQTATLPITGGGTASFTESSSGRIDGNLLTISGTWSKTGYNTASFQISATKN